MDPDRRRKLLFYAVCLPVRFLIAILGLLLVQVDSFFYAAFSVYCFATAIGFGVAIGLWACKGRNTGGLGGRIWWNRVRIVHTVLWVTAGILFAVRAPGGVVLLADALVGLGVGIAHHTAGIDF